MAEQRRRKWRWAGHAWRRLDGRWSNRLINLVPRGGKRRRGRPATRWEDVLVAFARSKGQKWETWASDRDIWAELEEEFVIFD